MKTSDLRNALEIIKNGFSAEMTLSQLEIFLIIAEKEGINEQDVSKQTMIASTTVNRNIAKLTERTQGAVWVKNVGYAVCEVKEDGSVFLTEKGKQILKELSTVS